MVLPGNALLATCLARAPEKTFWKLGIAQFDVLAKAAVTICLTRLDLSDFSVDFATLRNIVGRLLADTC
jgi:hypothetical protein